MVKGYPFVNTLSVVRMLKNPDFSKGRYFRHTFQASMTSLLRRRSKAFQERKQRAGTHPLERGLTSPLDNHISHLEKEELMQRKRYGKLS